MHHKTYVCYQKKKHLKAWYIHPSCTYREQEHCLQPSRTEICCCSVTKSCLTLCDPMDCSTPGFPIYHQLPELAETHVHRVGDAIQPSPRLPSPSTPAFNLSRHQGLFQWVSSSHQVAKGLELQLQPQCFQWVFRVDFLECWLLWSQTSWLIAVSSQKKYHLRSRTCQPWLVQVEFLVQVAKGIFSFTLEVNKAHLFIDL